MQDFQGKTAFITGGASGIGLGIAGAFVDEGMNVVIADLRQDHIDDALAEFDSRSKSEQVHAIRLDVTDREAFAAAADETESCSASRRYSSTMPESDCRGRSRVLPTRTGISASA